MASMTIHQAAQKGDLRIVRAILRDEPHAASSLDGNGWTALYHACCHDQIAVAQCLLRYGADIIPKVDGTCFTVLYIACMRGE